jgi:hypothetical protein
MTDSLPEPDPEPLPKPRSLWSLIPQSLIQLPPAEASVDADLTGPATNRTPHSLFKVMRRGMAGNPQADNTISTSSEHRDQAELHSSESQAVADTELPQVIPSVDAGVLHEFDNASEILPSESSPFFVLPIENQVSRYRSSIRSIWGPVVPLTCGLTSIGLSALAMRPEFWGVLPASILGFAATIQGFLLLSDSRPENQTTSSRCIALVSLLSGLCGMFLGPLYFAEWGRVWR